MPPLDSVFYKCWVCVLHILQFTQPELAYSLVYPTRAIKPPRCSPQKPSSPSSPSLRHRSPYLHLRPPQRPSSSRYVISSVAAIPVIDTIATQRASPTITVCSGSISPQNGCVTTPVVSEACINLTGGLSFLNKEISNVEVPGGFVCTFFQ